MRLTISYTYLVSHSIVTVINFNYSEEPVIKNLIILIALISSVNAFSYPKTPDISISPGQLCSRSDSDFKEYRYGEKIPYCRRNVSTRLKDQICARDGVYDRTGYTVDHIIPLSMGGSNSEKNLWCQSRIIYSGHLEFWLYIKLRDGDMRQAEAVHYIMSHKFNPLGKDHVPYPPEEMSQVDLVESVIQELEKLD